MPKLKADSSMTSVNDIRNYVNDRIAELQEEERNLTKLIQKRPFWGLVENRNHQQILTDIQYEEYKEELTKTQGMLEAYRILIFQIPSR
jgi:hypothetical protein